MAAAAEAVVINSAEVLEPGILESQVTNPGSVLPRQQGGAPFAPSNVRAFVSPAELPNPRPQRLLFGALKDPKLRLARAIPLEVSVEESTVVVSWAEIDEFGSGANMSEALDDFGHALCELYHRLNEGGVQLGPDLNNVKETLEKYVQRRTNESV